MVLVILNKAMRLWLVSTMLLSLTSACLSSPDLPKLEIQGVSLVNVPTYGQIADAAWSADSKLMLVVNQDEGPANGPRGSVYLLDVKEGKATPLLESMKLFNVRNPYLSADGLTASFAVESSPIGHGIHKLNLQTGELNLRFDASFAAWSNSQDAVALLNASECDSIAPRRSWICIMNAVTGKQKVIYSTNRRFAFGGMGWSRDNEYLAVSSSETDLNSTNPGHRRIYIYDLQSDQYSPITPDSVDAYDPAWSPDNKYIAYIQTEGKSTEARVMVMHADGSCPVPLISIKGLVESPAWSPDGNWLSLVYDFHLYKVDLNDEAIKRTLASCA